MPGPISGYRGQLEIEIPITPDPSVETVTAGEDISALQVVYKQDSQLFVASSDLATVYQILGVAYTGGSVGGEIQVRRFGRLYDPSFSFTLGPVWLDSSGSITQTPPVSGYIVLIGSAVSSAELEINVRFPIKLEV